MIVDLQEYTERKMARAKTGAMVGRALEAPGESRRQAAKSQGMLCLSIEIPADVKRWLQDQAVAVGYNCGEKPSLKAVTTEILRACRDAGVDLTGCGDYAAIYGAMSDHLSPPKPAGGKRK